MTDYARRLLAEFLATEFFCLDAANGIIQFVLDQNIRNGEYEGNEFVLKKLNFFDFILFKEYVDPSALCAELSHITVFKRDELLDEMHAMRDRIN